MVTYKKFIGILVLTIIGGLLTGRVYSADIKIGWVDMVRAGNECNAGKEFKKALTKEEEKLHRLFVEKQKELQTMKESFEKEILLLTSEAKANKEKEYQNKLREFQRWGEDIKRELDQKRIETVGNISRGLIKAAQEIGAKEGYTIILDKTESFVFFASKSTDLTDLVIKAYNMEKK